MMTNKPDITRRFVGHDGDIIFHAETMKAGNAPPVEMYDAWKDYDGLMADIGHAWAADYMVKVLPSILAVTNGEPTPIELQSALDAHHDALMADLLGTEEKPGAVVKLIMSGMAAGNASLVRGSAANPKRPMQIKDAQIAIDWELLAREAYNFAKQYIFDLIRNVDATTQKYVQEAVSKWIASGEPLDSLKRDFEAIFHDPVRADNIAETESTRAFATGAAERYQRADIKKVRLKPLNDSLVCEICKPLENTIVLLSDGWITASGTRFPPFHPRCRHWFVPVDDEEGI